MVIHHCKYFQLIRDNKLTLDYHKTQKKQIALSIQSYRQY